jgi:acyl-CoA synthetase (NDP forming)
VFAILESYGLPAVKTAVFKKKEDLLKSAEKVGYPLVLKVDAEDIVHKTEAGGVMLNLEDEKALRAAFGKMSRKFAKMKPAFILQEYLGGGREVIMGIKRNEGLQPTLMFGLGGIFVETLKDVQFRLAPLSQEDAIKMIRSIKGYPVLSGTRGKKPADVDSLADILQRLSALAIDFPSIDEMDLNPVLAFDKGKGAMVVDARMKIV